MSYLVCQKCKTPLEVDSSLQQLNPASFKILADAAPLLDAEPPGPTHSQVAKERVKHFIEASSTSESAPKRQSIAEQWRRGAPDQSYVVLSDSVLHKPAYDIQPDKPGKHHDGETALSEQLETTLRLFEILSARSDIDHPICSECTDLLLEGMQKRQQSVIRERDAYVQFLKQAEQDVPTDNEIKQSQTALTDVLQKEREALQELEALEAEKARLEDEIAALDAEAELLDEEEEQFWRERNAWTTELAAFQEEKSSLENQLAHDNKLLESLQRTNVYNDTFCISHDGSFGTINGLRLGRLPEQVVDWPEINAAWGQTLLCLVVIAEKLNVSFGGYKLHPMGSTSKIERIESLSTIGNAKQKRAMLELFTTGDVPLSFGFLHRSFDSGMVAFLDCLKQVGDHVERTSPRLRMPYKVSKDKINDISIKLGNFGQESEWTKACKYSLTCLKFLLAHASHADDAKTVGAVR